MDDSLEQPTALLAKSPPSDQVEEEDDQSSDEEDGGLDWTKLPGIARPVIPKRGEKDFEPKPGGGSGLQLHVLDRARAAMFDALRATRTISSKAVSYAIWYPNIGRSHVTLAKGIHFSSMGHSAPRPVLEENGKEKIQKRLELLPEETIYLVERGSLFCWKETDVDLSAPGMDGVAGVPMTVQQVHTEMIGIEDLTLEKYQVYTYLKRLGYAVTRTNPPSSYYPTPPPWPTATQPKKRLTIFQRILSIFPLWTSRLRRLLAGGFDWWRPLRISRWLHHDKNYGSLFRSLRFMSAGHNVPLHHPNPEKRLEKQKSSPYQIFYNLYKPSTPFKRSAPPLPDFQIVVINARTTPMPTLQELTDLFDELPTLPPPLPRQRRHIPPQTSTTVAANTRAADPGAIVNTVAPPPVTPARTLNPLPSPPVPRQSLIRRIFPWAFAPLPPQTTGQVRRPHPFMALKAGRKLIVIAVVDAGSISFFRFGQGDFTEWPMA
ncbi:putative tRNA-splicing endonuclease subunit sen54 [Hypsizygus marmoreus]|uniref:tRNA-splicing endonuclease subunit sen54 n=1 Tax=Hypsizygus marmoreus TaxID=39966 RepID=A0A369J2D1_HYPMA|nr:putative tRNA-splicing endonuclease subunit sen54 [Hypsizygus marmoreus]